MARKALLLTSFLAWAASVMGIEVTESDAAYTINAGTDDGFIVAVDRASCDLTSISYRGTEYQYAGTGSHVASGLGAADVSYTTSGDYVVVSCVASSDEFDLTQYLVFANAQSTIYLATDTASEPSVGELRYIFRLTGLPGAYPNGDVSYTVGGEAIEASDVYLVDGETRSKFFSSDRFIDDDVYCAVAEDESVHACYLANVQSREKSSGGPFFRDINLNNGGDYDSVTFYMNSGHVRTEADRNGFHGPYVLSFSRNGIPSADSLDTSFFEDFALGGYVGASGRGAVSGTASGVSTDFNTVVHWYNDDYQSWAYADSSGAFTSPALVAGTYTQALYQEEFLAATATVEVTAGSTTTQDIEATSTVLIDERTTIFQIGQYDGQPTGLLNADLQLRAHPSDSRMADWAPGTFTVGTSTDANFPMAIFAAVNSDQAISFSLDAAVDADATLRIATTLAFAGARPGATVNDFAGDTPAAPSKIDSRGVTRGAYRGYGEIYEWVVPAGTLVAGDNTVTISVVSGSSGDGFLSPNFIVDAIELFY